MAGSVNKVIILGNLGADPEVRSFQSGGKVVNLRIATSESWKDKNSGERKERTEWHSVAIFNEGIAKIAEQYLRKGSKVYLEGQLETRKWQDQSGADRYSTEVVLRPFNGVLTLLDGKPEGGGVDERPHRQSREPDLSSGGYGGSSRSDLDDEIPFLSIGYDPCLQHMQRTRTLWLQATGALFQPTRWKTKIRLGLR